MNAAYEATAPIGVAVLGDLALTVSGEREVRLSPQRAHILAVLVAAGGSIVSSAELAHDLWGEDSKAVRHRLKQQIAQIRVFLDRDLQLVFRNDGYRLWGSLDRVDAVLFESLVRSARGLDVAQRAGVYDRALALWRGSAFRGIDSDLVDDARRRLEWLRERTELDLADCEIELGRPGRARDALQRRFAEDHAAADVAARLAVLEAIELPDAGRRVITAHSSALRGEGRTIDKGLADLERRLLRHEFHTPATHATFDAHDHVHSGDRVLDRRDLERRVWEAVAVGPVLVVGEAGVGKTVLAQATTRWAERTARLVVEARAHVEATRPMEVLASFVDTFRLRSPERFDEYAARPVLAAAVARLTGERPPPSAPVLSRNMLIAELASLVRSFVTDEHGLLVIEDGHWLDHSSAEIIGQLVSDGIPGVLVTSRRPLCELFGAAWEGVETLEVKPFSLAEVDALVRLAWPSLATEQRVSALHRSSGGNGLFLRLELDRLAEGDSIDAIAPTLLAAVNKRTARLSEDTRSVLQTAALLGRSFPLRPLEVVHPRWRELLEAAVDERLIVLDAGAGRGDFLHGLVAEALVDDLLPVPREERHDLLCSALIAIDESSLAIATHALGAERLDPVRAVLSCLGAARDQALVFEWAMTIAWAGRGLEAIERSGYADLLVEGELRLLLGAALRRLNRPGSAEELAQASDLASLAGADELLVRCVTELCSHGPTSKLGTVDEAGRRHLERALDKLVPATLRAELLSAAATLMALSDDASVGRAFYRRALDVAEASGDPNVLRSVRINAHLGLCHPDDLAERRRACEGLLEIDDPESQWEGNFLRFGLALIDADRVAVDASTDAMRRLTSIVKQRDQQRAMLQIESVRAFVEGDLERAEALAGETFRASVASYPASWAMGIYAALLVPVREAQGRVAELEREVAALVASAPGFVTWHALSAIVAYANGDRPGMAREVRHLAEQDFAFAEDLTWTAVATIMCRPIWALRDVDSARVLAERLAPYSGTMTWNGLSTHGPVDAGLACLADVLGDQLAVDRLVASAADLVERLGTPHLHWLELDHVSDARLVNAARG